MTFKCNPKVGAVYRKSGGPKGYYVVVSDNGSLCHYISIDTQGNIKGVGYGTGYYFSRRQRVGFAVDIPGLQIKWERR